MSDVQIAVVDQQDTQIVLAVPGVQGATGSEIPTGGTADQVLRKSSSTNYDTNWSQVTSAMIADGTIVNADINASAAIAGTKISPDFGSQTVQTTGVISHALGTAGAPTVTFTGDTNTGIYSPGADQVAISTGGTGRLFVDASGNVGVNTASPSYQLDINGQTRIAATSTSAQLRLERTGTSSGHSWLGAQSDALLMVLDSSFAEKLRITSAGLVGIGTSSPSANLDARGTVALSQMLNVDGNAGTPITAGWAATGAGGKLMTLSNTAAGGSIGNGNTLYLANYSNDNGTYARAFNVTTSGADKFWVGSNGAGYFAGSVGIGIASPSVNFHINSPSANGEQWIASGTGFTSSLFLKANGSGGGLVLSSATDSSASVTNTLNAALTFGTNNTERARIDSSGRLGIGTSSPSYALDVSGQIRAAANATLAQLRLERTGSNTGHSWLGAQSDALLAVLDSSFAEKLRLDSSGRLLVGTSSTSSALPKLIVSGGADGGVTPAILVAGTDPTPAVDTALGAYDFSAANHSTAARIAARRDGGTWTAGSSQPTRLVFSTTADGASSPTEQLRITSDRYVRLASGTGGIQFNGDTAAANALDDYEEGTFTPTVVGLTTAGTGTYTSRNGAYTKIGNVVYFLLDYILTAHTGTGDTAITGLPFTSGTLYYSNIVGTAQNLDLTASYYLGGSLIGPVSTSVTLQQMPVGGGSAIGVPIDSVSDVRLQGFYFI